MTDNRTTERVDHPQRVREAIDELMRKKDVIGNRTTELREKLTERCIEYTTNDHMGAYETSWDGFTAMQLTPGAKLMMVFTPEQAIAATLGRGTGEWVLEHSGTLYDKWRCSKCGYLFVEPRCDQGYTDLEPNYCPNCGRKCI